MAGDDWLRSGPSGRKPVNVDTSTAHVARMYDYWLGGKDNFAADRAQVLRFFDGLDLLEPGLVPIQKWRPASELEANAQAAMWGGVARKPGG